MRLFPRVFTTILAGALIAVSATAPTGAAPATAAEPPSSSPPTIMLYGDSLTHAFNADWTWRYRLWQLLTASGQEFDFVGPRDDVAQYNPQRLGSQGYRNPEFDRDHAALGGTRFMHATYDVAELARTYRPDVVVALVGANDVVDGASIEDLREQWRKQIAKTRAFNRGVDFVLVQVPHLWINGIAEYNTMLNEVAAKMNTDDQRVVVTPLADFNRAYDTFDLRHLSAAGDRKMAAVVSEALAEVGIGNGRSAFASVESDPEDDHVTWAPQPTATVSGTTITLTWPAVTYALSMNVWARDRATGAVGVRRFVKGQTTTVTGWAGRSYDMWRESVKGYLPIGTTSHKIRIDVPAG